MGASALTASGAVVADSSFLFLLGRAPAAGSGVGAHNADAMAA